MKAIHSMIMAFSMYSKIPMPRIDWARENMGYAMCFFPLVGVAVTLLALLWIWVADLLQLTQLLRAAGLLLIPIAVTGGIHLDGLCDVADARASHQPKARKLEILKDSNCGAFALIGCCCYLLLSLALWYQFDAGRWNVRLAVLLIPVVSRAFSALAAVSFRNARGSGMLATFTDAAKGDTVRGVMVCLLALLLVVQLILSPLVGGFAFLFAAGSFVYYRWMAYREFGGITGDLAGWFLQICELAALGGAVLAQRLGAVL